MNWLALAPIAAALVSPAFAAWGAYTATKARLSVLEERISGAAAEAARANGRIDELLLERHA